MGATVERVRPSVSITHKDHFVNVARRRALEARATDSAPELQLYDLAKQDPQLEKKLDQHVKNRVSAVLDLEAVRPLSFQEPLTRSESGSTNASGPAVEEFVTSSEKEIVACVMAGSANGSDVKNSEAEHPSGNVFRVDASCDSSGQGRSGYFADQFKNLANLRGFGGSTDLVSSFNSGIRPGIADGVLFGNWQQQAGTRPTSLLRNNRSRFLQRSINDKLD